MHSSSSTTAGGVRKGAWTEEEDRLLRNCIDNYGEGKWHQVPHRAGLNRCRKSCRLRWLNYLRPNIKRGNFGLDEVDLIIRLHKLLGNRWSLIAGRLPGRTANDVKNYWNTHMKKKEQINNNNNNNNNNNEGRMRGRECTSCGKTTTTTTTEAPKTTIVKPRPRSFSKNSPWSLRQQMMIKTADVHIINVDQNPPSNHEVVPKVPQSSSSSSLVVPADHHHHHHEMQWLENLFNEENVISACSPLTDDRISNMWSEETWCGFGFGFGFGFGAEEGRGNNNNNHDEQNYFANILN